MTFFISVVCEIQKHEQKIGSAKVGIFVPWQTLVVLDLVTVFPADVFCIPSRRCSFQGSESEHRAGSRPCTHRQRIRLSLLLSKDVTGPRTPQLQGQFGDGELIFWFSHMS